MVITDPQAIRFVQEEVRSICEEIRAVKVRSAQITSKWFGSSVNLMFPNTSEVVADGRHERDGISQLTGADVNSVIGQLANISSQYNTDIIEKPCINPLRVS